MSTILEVVDDVIRQITGYIDAYDLCALYLTNPVLKAKLTRSVITFFNPATRFHPKCASFLSCFPLLREVELYQNAQYRHNWQRPFVLSSPPSSVQKLHLNFDRCDTVFEDFSGLELSEDALPTSFIDLNATYPYLTDLILAQLGTHTQQLLDQIPPTILRLALFAGDVDPKRELILKSLPHRLVSYQGNVAYKPEGYEFPETLEVWNAPSPEPLLLALPSSCKEILGNEDGKIILKSEIALPAQLERLEVHIETWPFAFPRTLRMLRLSANFSGIDLQDMASTLPFLQILSFQSGNPGITEFSAKSFPASLTSFTINCKVSPTAWRLWRTQSLKHIACSDRFDRSTISSLPKTLQSLELPQFLRPSIGSALVDFQNLTHLCLMKAARPVQPFVLPPSLTSLNVPDLIVPVDQSRYWPPSLTRLWVKDVWGETLADPGSSVLPPVFDLPKMITSLRIARFNQFNPDPVEAFSKIEEWKFLEEITCGSLESPASIALFPLLARLSYIKRIHLHLDRLEVLTREHLTLLKWPLVALCIQGFSPTTIMAEDLLLIPRTVTRIQLPKSPGCSGFQRYLPRGSFATIPGK
jgi:hypothetical protein